jgi:hypothetical protein
MSAPGYPISNASPFKRDAVFIQRDDTNLFYEKVSISGSNTIVYLDDDGYLNASKISNFYLSYIPPTASYSYTSATASFFSGSFITASVISVGTILPLASSIGSLTTPFTSVYAINFYGTSSIANTASFVTASNVVGTVTSSSYSYSSSLANTSSFITASNVVGTVTSSSYARSASVANTASFVTASNVIGTITSASFARSASIALQSNSASYVSSSGVCAIRELRIGNNNGAFSGSINPIYGLTTPVPTIVAQSIDLQVCDLDGLAGMSLIHRDGEYVDMNFIVNNGGFLESRVRYETRGGFTFTGTPELQYGSTQTYIGGFGYMPNMFLGGTYSSVTTGLSVGLGMAPTTPPTDGLYVKGKTGLNVSAPTAQLDVQAETILIYPNYTDYPSLETFTTTYPNLEINTVTGTYYDTTTFSNQAFYDGANGFLYSNYDSHVVASIDYTTGNVDTSLQTNTYSDYPSTGSFTTTYSDIVVGSGAGLYQDAGTLSQQSFYDGADGFLYSSYDNHIVASINYSTGTVDSTGYVSETIDQIDYSYYRNETIVNINYNYETTGLDKAANFNGDVSVTGSFLGDIKITGSLSTNGPIYSTHGYPTFMGNPGDGRFQLITTTPSAGDVGFSTFGNGFNFTMTGVDGGAGFYCDDSSNTGVNRRGGTQTFRLWADGTNVIYDGSGTGITLNGSGNVSIGTTTAINKLTVQGNISCSVVTASAHVVSCVTKTTNYTISGTDYYVIMSGSAALSASLPTAVGSNGRILKIKNVSTFPVYVSGSQKIDNSTFKILSQYDTMEIVSSGTQWWIG